MVTHELKTKHYISIEILISPIFVSRNNSVRDIDKYADEALSINRMVEQNITTSMHLSRSSSFYYEHQQAQQQHQHQQSTSKVDLAATPTASPDDDDEDYADGHRKSTSQSIFFSNKLQESLNNSSNAGLSLKRAPPIFKIEGENDEDEAEGQALDKYEDEDFYVDGETPLPSPLVRLTHLNSGVNNNSSNLSNSISLNESHLLSGKTQAASAPIDMKPSLVQKNTSNTSNDYQCSDNCDTNDGDGEEAEFSSTVKENIHFVKNSGELVGLNGDIDNASCNDNDNKFNTNNSGITNVNNECNEAIQMSKNANVKSKNKNKRKNKKKIFKVASSSSSSSSSLSSSLETSKTSTESFKNGRTFIFV